jgi:hypothetical protein
MLFLSAAASERPAAALSTAWRPRRFDAGQNDMRLRIATPVWRRKITVIRLCHSLCECLNGTFKTHFREILTPVNSL